MAEKKIRPIQPAVDSDTPRERIEAAVTAVHVTPTNNGAWEVKRFVHERGKETFRSQCEAVEHGREWSGRYGVALVIHEKDGTAREVAPNAQAAMAGR